MSNITAFNRYRREQAAKKAELNKKANKEKKLAEMQEEVNNLGKTKKKGK